MYLWRPWLLPLLYHAHPGARDIYRRSVALVTQTSPSRYKQEDGPIGEIEQCDGLQDKGTDGECKKLWKGSLVISGPKNLLSKFMALSFSFHEGCYASLPLTFCLGGAVPNCRKQGWRMHFGNASAMDALLPYTGPIKMRRGLYSTQHPQFGLQALNRRRPGGHC
jgi:hypothetical protein